MNKSQMPYHPSRVHPQYCDLWRNCGNRCEVTSAGCSMMLRIVVRSDALATILTLSTTSDLLDAEVRAVYGRNETNTFS